MQQRWLEADEATGELRLVITDYDRGQHHRDEFRAVGDDGHPLRAARLPDVIGLTVDHRVGPVGSEYSVRMQPHTPPVRVHVETYATGPTQVTACPRAESRRRKCPLCAAAAARSAS